MADELDKSMKEGLEALHELLSAALLMIERPDWPRVEVFERRITRGELCSLIRKVIPRRLVRNGDGNDPHT